MATLGRILNSFRTSTRNFPIKSNRYGPLRPVRFLSSKLDEKAVASGVELTDACVKQLQRVMKSGEHLRVIVEGGGCSGFQYKFDIDSKIESDDKVFEKDGATVVVDEDTLEFIKGSKIDYQEELIKSAFAIIENPLAEEGCSCGASFNLKL